MSVKEELQRLQAQREAAEQAAKLQSQKEREAKGWHEGITAEELAPFLRVLLDDSIVAKVAELREVLSEPTRVFRVLWVRDESTATLPGRSRRKIVVVGIVPSDLIVAEVPLPIGISGRSSRHNWVSPVSTGLTEEGRRIAARNTQIKEENETRARAWQERWWRDLSVASWIASVSPSLEHWGVIGAGLRVCWRNRNHVRIISRDYEGGLDEEWIPEYIEITDQLCASPDTFSYAVEYGFAGDVDHLTAHYQCDIGKPINQKGVDSVSDLDRAIAEFLLLSQTPYTR